MYAIQNVMLFDLAQIKTKKEQKEAIESAKAFIATFPSLKTDFEPIIIKLEEQTEHKKG